METTRNSKHVRRRAALCVCGAVFASFSSARAEQPPYARFDPPNAAAPPVIAPAPPILPAPLPAAPTGKQAPSETDPIAAETPAYPGIQVMPIDLPTALRLVDVRSPTVGLALARVQEAFYRYRQARVQWIPDLVAGPSYQRHDGLLQTSRGAMIFNNKWNLFAGGGAALGIETSDALFGPLIARRLLEAETAASRGVSDDVQLQVALAYFDLVRAYGALAINAETLANAMELDRLAESAQNRGFGRTPADANRARVEVTIRRQERSRLIGDAGAASARLTQLLNLDPIVQLRPADPAVVPIEVVPRGIALGELVGAGWMNRPELAESRALVAASLARLRQARLRPLLPRLQVSYAAGEFGGGLDDNSDRFGGRGDATAQAVWTLRNFGAGDIANARATRSQVDQANFHVAEVQARVAAEVTSAATLAASRFQTLDAAQRGVDQAEKMWQRIVKWSIAGISNIKRIEELDILLAEQALNQARVEYLGDVTEFNQQQFRLYWTMGQPPLEALPRATTVPVAVSVTPPRAMNSAPK